jgi:hypothetical protein
MSHQLLHCIGSILLEVRLCGQLRRFKRAFVLPVRVPVHAPPSSSPATALPVTRVHSVRLTGARRACSAAEVKSAGWTRSSADVREWLDSGAAMVGGGAAETALTEALAEAAGMFVLPPHTGRQP